MVTEQMTDEQLERHAFKVLAKELGLGGLARFIRLNCSGRVDYTASRHIWQAEMTVDDIRRELEAPVPRPDFRTLIAQSLSR